MLVRSILLMALCVGGWPGAAGADVLHREAQTLLEQYRADLHGLATWCTEQGLTEQSRETLDILGPSDPYKLYIPNLPREVGPPVAPANASAELSQWYRQLQQIRAKYGSAFYDLAQRAVRVRPSLAYELALTAIRANPDHEAVRRIFGFQKYLGEWRTAYEVAQFRAGKLWDDRFGWLPKSHLHRYEQGLRFRDGRWITAEDDAKQRIDIRNGWDIETEHYQIRTNHSLEAGVQLGTKLEALHGIWQQLFIRFYASQADVVALFSGRAQRRSAAVPRFQVAFFRDRGDYNRSLRAAMPNIDVSIGVYVPNMRRAYFFAGSDYDERTLFHEATHQLFQESRRTAPNLGTRGNFWIVEGIALLMESLHREGNYWVLGGLDDPRFYAARVRLLRDDFYVPLSEFTRLNMTDVQTSPRIATLYSQAAGLTHFLVFQEEGGYRDALVQYLSVVYSGRDTPQTLAELLGAGYAEADTLYRQFITNAARSAAGPVDSPANDN